MLGSPACNRDLRIRGKHNKYFCLTLELPLPPNNNFLIDHCNDFLCFVRSQFGACQNVPVRIFLQNAGEVQKGDQSQRSYTQAYQLSGKILRSPRTGSNNAKSSQPRITGLENGLKYLDNHKKMSIIIISLFNLPQFSSLFISPASPGCFCCCWGFCL